MQNSFNKIKRIHAAIFALKVSFKLKLPDGAYMMDDADKDFLQEDALASKKIIEIY